MMDTSLNIVELIENNPITRLSGVYQNKLLVKIKDKFTDNEQHMFVASFYCFLNHDQRNDFVIDFDDVWQWLGFTLKENAKRMLLKQFNLDIDYKFIARQVGRANNSVKQNISKQGNQTTHPRGGHNKEIIMLTIRTFKLFCLKAGTKKAEQIHEYYVKLEETLQEVIQEESNELKMQLEQKQLELKNHLIISEKDKEQIREKTLIEQFPNNTQCVYYGIIDNLSDQGEKLVKFGNSNNLKYRVKQHKDTYLNFRLVNAFKVENKLQIENAIKESTLLNERQRIITLKYKKYVELLNVDGITFAELDKKIKEIITSIEYSPDNYIKILEDNRILKKQLEQKNEINNNNKFILLTAENTRLKNENIKLIKKNNTLKRQIHPTDSSDVIENTFTVAAQEEVNVTQNEIENYGINLNTCKKIIKNKDGKYNIDGKIYDKIIGSRTDVWEGKTYKTAGCLIKSDLMINKSGKIVSMKKCIEGTIGNRFEKYRVNKPKEKPKDVIATA